MSKLEELLKDIPSRIYTPDKNHPEHQLVMEKFPNGKFFATYVCLGCKGKATTASFNTLEEALEDMIDFVKLGVKEGLINKTI